MRNFFRPEYVALRMRIVLLVDFWSECSLSTKLSDSDHFSVFKKEKSASADCNINCLLALSSVDSHLTSDSSFVFLLFFCRLISVVDGDDFPDPNDTLANELNQWDKPKKMPPVKAQPLAPADDRAQMYNDVQWDPALQGYDDVQYPGENTPAGGYKSAGPGDGQTGGQNGEPSGAPGQSGGAPGQNPGDGHPGDPYGEPIEDPNGEEEV